MLDSQISDVDSLSDETQKIPQKPTVFFALAKRSIDVGLGLCFLPPVFVAWVVLWWVNPRYNPGPIYFIQKRMGQNGQPFNLYKFITMTPSTKARGAGDPLETHRITKLGAILRRSRVDELPQVFNVLKGDMSFIGPRPDMFDHALEFRDSIPGYSKRFSVRPGITGLAQTEVGYAEGFEETRRKVAADLQYIKRQSALLDTWIFFRTLQTVFLSKGR